MTTLEATFFYSSMGWYETIRGTGSAVRKHHGWVVPTATDCR